MAGPFGLVEQHLPHSLVGEMARRRLREVVSVLPASLSSCLYIECRPNDSNNTDLIADITTDGRRMLAQAGPTFGMPASLRQYPAWARIETLATHWNRPGNPLHEELSGAWLE